MNAAEILEKHVGHRFHFIMDHTTMNAMKEYAGKFAGWCSDNGWTYWTEYKTWDRAVYDPVEEISYKESKTTEQLLTEFENS
jgi:hypothetical protein